jgi:hypothetical protein
MGAGPADVMPRHSPVLRVARGVAGVHLEFLLNPDLLTAGAAVGDVVGPRDH